MRQTVTEGAVAFIVSFCFCPWLQDLHCRKGEKALSLFAGAALINHSAEDTPGATETDLAIALKEKPDELIADGTRFLRNYGYLPQTSYINQHKLTWINLALALASGLLVSFQSAREEKKLKRELLELSDYLRALHRGEDKLVLRDDLFGQLRDDIYKTILILRELRETP